jgi:hypothetical protein
LRGKVVNNVDFLLSPALHGSGSRAGRKNSGTIITIGDGGQIPVNSRYRGGKVFAKSGQGDGFKRHSLAHKGGKFTQKLALIYELLFIQTIYRQDVKTHKYNTI